MCRFCGRNLDPPSDVPNAPSDVPARQGSTSRTWIVLGAAGALILGLVLGGLLFLTNSKDTPAVGSPTSSAQQSSVPSPAETLNTANLEATLKSQLETQLNANGLTVTCPPVVTVQVGETFNCTASDTSGRSVTIEVTQADDQGNVTWKVSGKG